MVRQFNYKAAAGIAAVVTCLAFYWIGGLPTILFIGGLSFIWAGAALIFIDTEWDGGWRMTILSQLLEEIQSALIRAGLVSLIVPALVVGVLHRDLHLSYLWSGIAFLIFSQLLWWVFYKDVRKAIDEYSIIMGTVRVMRR